nr:hypothetical protein [uncultured Pseudomonas sp.]
MRNYSGWFDASSTCKPVLTQTTETKSGVQEETCDSYNGASKGTYYGTVYKYGMYTTTYSADAKVTDTKFEVASVDSTACIAQITDITQETDELPCPPGQSGSIQRYRIKAQDSKGLISYPYGESWIISNNNCASVQADNNTMTGGSTTANGLLSNISTTSSDLRTSDRFSKYLNELSGSGWNSSQKQKLVIEVDDINTGSFSPAKLGSAISKFQTVVGSENSEVEIKLPRTIDQFVGLSGITQEAVQNKRITMKGVNFDGYDAEVTYLKLGDGSLSTPQEKTTKVNIIPKGMGLKNIGNE